MSEQCEVCGRRLTMFYRAWGTNKCSPCATGRSPASKKRSVTDALERAPYTSEEEIGKSGRLGALGGALVLLFFINVGAFVCHLVADVSGNDFFFAGEIAAFYVGIKVVGGAFFGNADLLTLRRWKSCWHADVLGYIVGIILALVAIRSVGSAAFVLPPVTAIVFALLNCIWADRRNIRKTRERFREWRDSQSGQGTLPAQDHIQPTVRARREIRWFHLVVAILLPIVGLPWGVSQLMREKWRSALLLIGLSALSLGSLIAVLLRMHG